MPTLTTINKTQPNGATRLAKKTLAAPGADAITAAYLEAITTRRSAAIRTLECGFLLIWQRSTLFGHSAQHNQHTEEDQRFTDWLKSNCPDVPERTAYRWMKAAENSAKAALGDCKTLNLESGCIDIDSVSTPISNLLTMPDEELSKQGLEYKQQYFDWTRDKTIKECLEGVGNDGDDPSRIIRAHNGKSAGGSNGEDRKDYPKFIKEKLKHITTFLYLRPARDPHKFRHLSALVQTQIVQRFTAAVQRWPKWLLEPLAEAIKKEMKLDDDARLARNKQNEGKDNES